MILRSAGVSLSFAAVLHALREDRGFSDFFLKALAATPFEAFFWEMPPLVASNIGKPYEHVTIDSPALRGVREDGSAFALRFAEAEAGHAVTAFHNLSGGALLVAPRAAGAAGANAHIAAFVRGAPRPQQRELLALTAELALERLSERPTWISTSGTGVHWLHVRIEGAPAYYVHRPYKVHNISADAAW
jgi:hypothetical protein